MQDKKQKTKIGKNSTHKHNRSNNICFQFPTKSKFCHLSGRVTKQSGENKKKTGIRIIHLEKIRNNLPGYAPSVATSGGKWMKQPKYCRCQYRIGLDQNHSEWQSLGSRVCVCTRRQMDKVVVCDVVSMLTHQIIVTSNDVT